MKKTIASFVFVLSFVVYAVYDHVHVVATPSIVATSAPTPKVAVTNPAVDTGAAPPEISPSASVNVPVPKKIVVPAPTVAAKKKYNDGTYVGAAADAYYGNVQVKLTIANDKITDIALLDYPQDRRTSIAINSEAIPMLTQEAITAQSANINGVSGASDTSAAFRQSLSSALSQALA